MTTKDASDIVLEPGVYTVRYTLRKVMRIPEGTRITEQDVMDDIEFDAHSNLVDWSVVKG